MTPKELLHEIVIAENEARVLHENAVREQEGFEESLEKTRLELREEIFGEAENKLRAHEEREVLAADDAMAKLDKAHNADMEKLRNAFESQKERVAEKLFNIVVGTDDE